MANQIKEEKNRQTISFADGLLRTAGCSLLMFDTPRGNRRLKLSLTGRRDAAPSDTWIFAGRRALVAAVGDFKGSCEVSATVHVAEPQPGEAKGQLDDHKLRLSVLAPSLEIADCRILATDCATIHVAGGTAAACRPAFWPYDPARCAGGFAQMLSYYLPDGVAVAFHGRAGLTTEGFRSEGYLQHLLDDLVPGDYVLLHFGSDDRNVPALGAKTGYTENMIRILDAIREKKARPILATPIAQNTWEGSIYYDGLREYEETVLRLGDRQKLPVLDLHARTSSVIARLGQQEMSARFVPGDGVTMNDCGAFAAAGIIASEIRRVLGWEEGYVPLAEAVDKQALGEGDPATALFKKKQKLLQDELLKSL